MVPTGSCLPENLSEAIVWHERAAEQGYLYSQKKLAYIHRYLLADIESAIVWYRMAAESGDTKAARTMGEVYSNGKGVEVDMDEAVKWYMQAALRGDRNSQRILEEKFNDPASRREQQRLAEENQREILRRTEERKNKALESYGIIGVTWVPTDPDFVRDTVKSHTESQDTEGRGYLYAPMVLVSWPAWIATAIVGETAVEAKKAFGQVSARAIHKELIKLNQDSEMQTFFVKELLEATKENLDNPIKVTKDVDENDANYVEKNIDTVLELRNGLFKITTRSDYYRIGMEAEYKLIDNANSETMYKEIIKIQTGRYSVKPASDSKEYDKVDTELVRKSLEEAYTKLAHKIVESILSIP
jgi:hypothetical protein